MNKLVDILKKAIQLIGSLSLLLLFVLVFSACEKDEDNQSPVASIETPSIGEKYYRGHVIYLNALFTDDENLDRCEVSIASSKGTFGWDDPWFPETDVIKLSGTTHPLEDYLLFNGPIPHDIMSAAYVINIRVYDSSGNMTHYSRNIEIE